MELIKSNLELASKTDFINVTNNRIKARFALIDFYKNVYLPTLQKFNGKVYNIRFIKALREANKDELLVIRERTYYKTIELNYRQSKFSYNNYEALTVDCPDDSNNRLSYELCENGMQEHIKNFNDYTEEIQSAIDNYDKYLEQAMELQKKITEYNELPSAFRQNISKYRMTIY